MRDVRSASYHITQSNYLSAEQSLPICPNWGIQVHLLEHKHNQNLILTEKSLSTTEKNSGLSTNHGRFERGETQPNSSELAKKIDRHEGRALAGTKAPGLPRVQMVGKMRWIPSWSSTLLLNLKTCKKKKKEQ